MSVSAKYDSQLAFWITKPSVYADHILRYVVEECDICLADPTVGDTTHQEAEGRRASFVAVLNGPRPAFART